MASEYAETIRAGGASFEDSAQWAMDNVVGDLRDLLAELPLQATIDDDAVLAFGTPDPCSAEEMCCPPCETNSCCCSDV